MDQERFDWLEKHPSDDYVKLYECVFVKAVGLVVSMLQTTALVDGGYHSSSFKFELVKLPDVQLDQPEWSAWMVRLFHAQSRCHDRLVRL